MSAIDTYNMYGTRQEEFDHLPDWAQAEVVEYCHTFANVTDYIRGLEVVQIMPSGLKITRAMLDEEIRSTRIKSNAVQGFGQRGPMIIGINASSNMYA